jgi:hypothetical protein
MAEGIRRSSTPTRASRMAARSSRQTLALPPVRLERDRARRIRYVAQDVRSEGFSEALIDSIRPGLAWIGAALCLVHLCLTSLRFRRRRYLCAWLA